MAFSESLAERIRNSLQRRHVSYEEKKMMGGLTFMVDDKMCVGIAKHSLMVRVGKENYEQALKRKGCKQMDFTGRPLKGFVLVTDKGMDTDEEFEVWMEMALRYNKVALKSKK